MTGPLSTTELNTPLLSAANITATGNITLAGVGSIICSGGNVLANTVSAAVINATTLQSLTLFQAFNQINLRGQIIGKVSSNSEIATSSFVSATNGFSGSQSTMIIGDVFSTIIVSAAGTAQATGALINSNFGINYLQGTTDGQTTGFRLAAPVNKEGLQQTLIHQGAVSGNLWPSVGCHINGLGANAAFALAANTPYYVTYLAASAYAVK